MKKLISSFLLATTIFIAVMPKKADAGIIFLGSSFSRTFNQVEADTLRLSSAVFSGVGVVLVALASPIAGVTLLVLGENEVSRSDLASTLAQKYSFIQDDEVIESLATLILNKAEGHSSEVKLSREEILEVLSPTDVVETYSVEVEEMIQELN